MDIFTYIHVCADVYLMVYHVPGIYNKNKLTLTEHLLNARHCALKILL